MPNKQVSFLFMGYRIFLMLVVNNVKDSLSIAYQLYNSLVEVYCVYKYKSNL